MIENLFLSVGAMKAGTTWLYDNLKKHPKIYFTPEKELHYFEHVSGKNKPLRSEKRREIMIDELANKSTEYITRNIDRLNWYLKFGMEEVINDTWYQNLFSLYEVSKDGFCADFSNLYALLNHHGWKRVRQNARNIRVIYTMRDPVKRVWSHYKFHMAYVGQREAIIDAGIDTYLEMISKDWFWPHAEYDVTIKRLKKVLRPDEMHIGFFEDFRSNPELELEKITNFLGLETLPEGSIHKSAINKSANIEMPKDWETETRKRLQPTINNLREDSLVHTEWM